MTRKKKRFDAVQMTRDIRRQIYEEIKDMEPEKIRTYFSSSKTKPARRSKTKRGSGKVAA